MQQDREGERKPVPNLHADIPFDQYEIFSVLGC